MTAVEILGRLNDLGVSVQVVGDSAMVRCMEGGSAVCNGEPGPSIVQ